MIAMFVDPGGTTGWCIMEWNGETEIKPEILSIGETPGSDFPRLLDKMLPDETIDRVVYESFRIFKGTVGAKALPVIKQIGQIEWVCQSHGIPFDSQPPSKKQFFENKLRAMGYHQANMPHARDAINHGLSFFMELGVEGRTPNWVLTALED